MKFSFWFDTTDLAMGRSIVFIDGSQVSFPHKIVLLSLKTVCVFTNSVDPDKMLYYAAFHLCLHFSQKNT